MNKIISKFLLLVIKGYRYFLSPWMGQHCRFHPTCSAYAMQAIEIHGPWRGSWLAVKRVASCHPWHEGGLDPVPQVKRRG